MTLHAVTEGPNAYHGPRPSARLHAMQAGKRRKIENGTLVIDSKKQRVYDAEGVIPAGKDLPTVPLMQGYVDSLLNEAWFRRRWGRMTIKVKDGSGCSAAAHGGYGAINMPKWSRHEKVVLHEIAHNLTPEEVGRRLIHGDNFVRVLLELVGHVYGVAEARLFRAELRKLKVSIGPALKLRANPPPARKPVAVKVFRVKLTVRQGKTSKVVEKTYNVSDPKRVLQEIAWSVGPNVTRIEVWRGRAPSEKQIEAARKKDAATKRARARQDGKPKILTAEDGRQVEIGMAGAMGVAADPRFKRNREYGFWIARCVQHGEWTNYRDFDVAQDAAELGNNCVACPDEPLRTAAREA